mgnify:CR=1 FL=1
MLKAHIDAEAEISIATIPVTAKDATDFGIMKTDEQSMITSFIEKPKTELLPDWTSDTGEEMIREGKHFLASMGIYIFNRDVLIKMLNENPEEKDFGKEIIPRALENPESVNQRRKAVGLEPLEKYLNGMSEMHFMMNKDRYEKAGILKPKLYPIQN